MQHNTEHFTYDAADRLTNWTINNTAYTADYSGNGNITMKSDFCLILKKVGSQKSQKMYKTVKQRKYYDEVIRFFSMRLRLL